MFPCARALDPRGKTLIATRALFWLKMGRRYCIVSVSCTSYTFALFSIKNIHNPYFFFSALNNNPITAELVYDCILASWPLSAQDSR